MKVYITKYALTKGIYEIEAEICENINPDMIKSTSNRNETYHGKGNNWHTDRDKALIAAKGMRDRKIKSLHTQINKLNKLTFE